jgi:hypothetical protein
MGPSRSSPPVAVVVAGVAAIVGAVPGVFAALLGAGWLLVFIEGIVALPWTEGADPGEVLMLPMLVQLSLSAVGLPVRMAAAGDRNAWPLLLALGPAVAPVVAFAPSVRRWLDPHPA